MTILEFCLFLIEIVPSIVSSSEIYVATINPDPLNREGKGEKGTRARKGREAIGMSTFATK